MSSVYTVKRPTADGKALRERVEALIAVAESGCHEWQGTIDAVGRGRITVDGKQWTASRLVWTIAHGEIEPGLWVLHHCDNPRCVRSDHLYLGTARENSRDASERGRLCHGERHGSSRLTVAGVRDIRRRRVEGETWAGLAQDYGVTPAAVRFAAIGRTWRRVV